jgi:hypothetical protein
MRSFCPQGVQGSGSRGFMFFLSGVKQWDAESVPPILTFRRKAPQESQAPTGPGGFSKQSAGISEASFPGSAGVSSAVGGLCGAGADCAGETPALPGGFTLFLRERSETQRTHSSRRNVGVRFAHPNLCGLTGFCLPR